MTRQGRVRLADNRTALRWYVFTDQGRKVIWAPCADWAWQRADARGLTVTDIQPAPPMGVD